MKKNNLKLYILLAVTLIITVVATKITFSSDSTVNDLISGTVSRIAVWLMLLILLVKTDKGVLAFNVKPLMHNLVWCIPCFLVVIANFPFNALIKGTAHVERLNLLWLFTLNCLSIGLLEEFFFRGFIHVYVKSRMKGKTHGCFWSVVISSAIFGLWHLTNLFYGAGILGTLMQVGYSFLIGSMLAVVFDATKNLWLCVLLHTLFDFGGNLVTTLGSGVFQDTVFWILTIVFGTIAAVYIIINVVKADKTEKE